MNKRILLTLFVFCIGVLLCAQTTTNNNTVVINGDVYYFRPSTQQSSPMPKAGGNGFISYGRWYGEDAAKAWASIADWAIEHCERADPAIKPRQGARMYISSVESSELSYSGWGGGNRRITIYYWVVDQGERMEDGHRETRTFYF